MYFKCSVSVFFYIISFYVEDVTSQSNNLESQLLGVFKKWGSGDVKDLPFALPILDPIQFASFQGNYKGKGVSLTYNSGDMNVTGVENFLVQNLRVADADLKANITIIIPTVTVFSDTYTIDGKAYLFYPLKGHGKLRVDFKNMNLSLAILIAPNGNGSIIQELKFNFYVNNIKVNLEASTWPINQVLNAEGLNMLKIYHNDIVKAAQDYMTDIANQYLATITPTQIIKTLSNLSL